MKNIPISPIKYEDLNAVNKEFEKSFKEAFCDFLDSGYFILGNRVKEFEVAFQKYLDSGSCIGVASGLDALTISLKALDFPNNSEVIVPSNTYIATIIAILNARLKPILVEPDIRSYNLDSLKIEEKISKKTKAIMPVHLYGKISDMGSIMQIANSHKLRVIEDVAQAHGAMYNNKKAGTFGDFGAFSFYPTKNLGALGDAGAIACNTIDLEDKIRSLRNYGSSKKYVFDYIGLNSRLDELQAAFLLIKLQKLDKINKHKRSLATLYNTHLSDKFIKPIVQKGYYDVYHIYAIRHPKRDELRSYLDENQIKTEIHYPIPPHHQKSMQGIIKGNYPISEEIHKTILSLPISYCHTNNDIMRVIEVMNRFK